jgi:hypothetical protein
VWYGLRRFGQELVVVGFPILLTEFVIGASVAMHGELAVPAPWLFGLPGRSRPTSRRPTVCRPRAA